MIQFINSDFSAGMNNFILKHNDSYMYNSTFLIIKKSEITWTRFINHIDHHTLFSLLPGISP